MLSRLGGINLHNASDFKLLDRIVVDAITRALPERQRFYRGLADWVGYRHASVPLRRRGARRRSGQVDVMETGRSRDDGHRLVHERAAPDRHRSWACSPWCSALRVGTDALVGWLQGRAVSGFTTTIITLLIVGSFIMISLGIIGEYIAKIYDEIKARPSYLVESTVGLADEATLAPGRPARERRDGRVGRRD